MNFTNVINFTLLLYDFYSGIDIAGSTVGMAFINTICGRLGVGLTQDTGRSVDSVGGIMAHELGHLFGMNHDDGSEYTRTVFAYVLIEQL